MPPSSPKKLRIVCISDTHNTTPALPAGDILIHAGDLTIRGTISELDRQLTWLATRGERFAARILVAGNHDLALDAAFYAAHGARAHSGLKGKEVEDVVERARRMMVREDGMFTYLEHEVRDVELVELGVKMRVLGSPWSRRIGEVGMWAFGYEDGDKAEKRWADFTISKDEVGSASAQSIDIVVVHGPPKGICDEDRDGHSDGCEALLMALGRIKPRLVVCGHRHEGRGCAIVEWNSEGGVKRIFRWKDPGIRSGKLSLVDLTGKKGSWELVREYARLEENNEATIDIEIEGDEPPSEIDDAFSLVGLLKDSSRSWTCIVNAAIMANSYGGPKQFNKPIVVDMELVGS
jgi:Calcineurin-like phosphoesterase